MPAETLAELQRRFHQLVTAPESVPRQLEKGEVTRDELAQLIRGDGKLSAAERLDIYANMYFFRIRDVLRDDYAKVVQLVGDEAFHNLATDFLVAHPPEHFSLRNAGVKLPAFLATHALATQFPFVAELAQLERQRLEVFDAADADVLDLDELRARPPETFATLALQLIPAHVSLTTRFPVADVWQAFEDATELPELAAQETTYLVWRVEPMIHHRALEADELALLPLLQAGVSFGVVCERLSERHPDEDVAPLAFRLLATWVQEGLLIRDDDDE